MVCFYFGEDYGLTYKRSSDFFDGKEYKKKGDINILRSTRTDRNETTE